MKRVAFLSALIAATIVGCSNPADDVPEAKVTSATNGAASSEGAKAPEPGGKYFVFGPDGSKVEYVGSKVTGSHSGGFSNFVGELQVINGKLADTGNKVVIDTTSLWSDSDRLTKHLQSPDFFDVAKFPVATFETTSVQQQTTNFTVTGKLALHGVTNQISFPATIDVSDSGVTATAVFFINRFDFGITYAGKADDLIRKEVVLKLSIKATPGRAKFESINKTPQTASL